MLTPDALRSAELKIQRANEHILELQHISNPLPQDFYELRVKTDIIPPYLDRFKHSLVYRPVEPIPEIFALRIGDAIHNLRASLDHAATSIVRSVNAGSRVYFPMRKRREDIETPDAKTKKTLDDLEAALPGATRLLLDTLRPENDTRDRLWSFFVLDNDDKHNLLLPVITVSEISEINVRIGTGTIRKCGVGSDATKQITIIRSTETSISLENDPDVAVEVRFGQGTPFVDDPVIETLVQIRNLVADTVSGFRDLIIRNRG